MEENQKPHRVSRRDQNGTHWSNNHGAKRRDRREEDSPELNKRSGKKCRSWAAAAIADCVALCCCPCAVVNLFTLAFVKVPWMIGRRCIGRRKRSREDRFNHRRIKCPEMVEEDGVRLGGCCGGGGGEDHRFVVERDGSLTKEEMKTVSFKGDEETRISARVEAEKVWLELYQIGHFGFGRVSFTGEYSVT